MTKMDTGSLPLPVGGIREEYLRSAALTRLYNSLPATEREKRNAYLTELFAECGEAPLIKSPFHCRFGKEVYLGDRFFANSGCAVTGRHPVTIGNHVQFGPKVILLAETGPVAIGDDVWIGGTSVVCSGVHIGQGTVIGAGSVVTEDIPPNVVAAGNPCRVMRKITEKDRSYWEKELTDYRTLCDMPVV